MKAGGVVFRKIRRGGDRVFQILLVTSKTDPSRWILPKGTPEVGESTEMAAVREIEEEAGVHGELVVKLGIVRRPTQAITYFLFRCTGPLPRWEEDGLRERRWVLLAEAESQIGQSDLHGIVALARRALSRD